MLRGQQRVRVQDCVQLIAKWFAFLLLCILGLLGGLVCAVVLGFLSRALCVLKLRYLSRGYRTAPSSPASLRASLGEVEEVFNGYQIRGLDDLFPEKGNVWLLSF